MRIEDRLDARPESVLDITPAEADRQRAEYEQAMDEARERMAAQADLERRAATDPDAALAIVQQRFRRYQRAMQDGTAAEKRGERGELCRALAHYNALTGRTTTREAVA